MARTKANSTAQKHTLHQDATDIQNKLFMCITCTAIVPWNILKLNIFFISLFILKHKRQKHEYIWCRVHFNLCEKKCKTQFT